REPPRRPGSARRRAARRAPALGDWVLSAHVRGAWSGEAIVADTMLPAVKTTKAPCRATPTPWHALQSHASPRHRACLSAGPRPAGRRPGRSALVADPEPVDAASLRGSRPGDRLRRRDGARVEEVA